MPGIARRRAWPADRAGGVEQVDPAQVTSPAARMSARERPAERSQERNAAGARRAMSVAPGRVPRPLAASRRPKRRMRRRWMAVACSPVMSCSQTAQASASNGCGRRAARSSGASRIERPSTGSAPKRSAKGRRSSLTAVQKRARASPASAAAASTASALSRTARPERHARSVTGTPPRWTSRSTTSSRRRARRSQPSRGRLTGQAGVTSASILMPGLCRREPERGLLAPALELLDGGLAMRSTPTAG